MVVPQSRREAVRAEYRRTFSYPFETLSTLAFNAVIVTIGWYLMPVWVTDLLFSIHRPMAFAAVLAIWMYSDVPSTNILGSESDLALKVLDDPDAISRVFFARAFVVWSIAMPVSVVAALILGIQDHNMSAALFGAGWLITAPFAILAIAPWFGIFYPYHPISLRERWERRRDWRGTFRWGFVLMAPYVIVPAIGMVTIFPSLLIWGFSPSAGATYRTSLSDFSQGLVVGLVIFAVAVFIGQRGSLRLIERRRDRLVAYLSDTSLG